MNSFWLLGKQSPAAVKIASSISASLTVSASQKAKTKEALRWGTNVNSDAGSGLSNLQLVDVSSPVLMRDFIKTIGVEPFALDFGEVLVSDAVVMDEALSSSGLQQEGVNQQLCLVGAATFSSAAVAEAPSSIAEDAAGLGEEGSAVASHQYWYHGTRWPHVAPIISDGFSNKGRAWFTPSCAHAITYALPSHQKSNPAAAATAAEAGGGDEFAKILPIIQFRTLLKSDKSDGLVRHNLMLGDIPPPSMDVDEDIPKDHLIIDMLDEKTIFNAYAPKVLIPTRVLFFSLETF